MVSKTSGHGSSFVDPSAQYFTNVGKTMSFLPLMTGNGKHTTYKSGDDWGMVYDGFPHINLKN